MRMKPFTVYVGRETDLGHIRVKVMIQHKRGEYVSEVRVIKEHTIGRKIEAIMEEVEDMIRTARNNGTLEDPKTES